MRYRTEQFEMNTKIWEGLLESVIIAIVFDLFLYLPFTKVDRTVVKHFVFDDRSVYLWNQDLMRTSIILPKMFIHQL